MEKNYDGKRLRGVSKSTKRARRLKACRQTWRRFSSPDRRAVSHARVYISRTGVTIAVCAILPSSETTILYCTISVYYYTQYYNIPNTYYLSFPAPARYAPRECKHIICNTAHTHPRRAYRRWSVIIITDSGSDGEGWIFQWRSGGVDRCRGRSSFVDTNSANLRLSNITKGRLCTTAAVCTTTVVS